MQSSRIILIDSLRDAVRFLGTHVVTILKCLVPAVLVYVIVSLVYAAIPKGLLFIYMGFIAHYIMYLAFITLISVFLINLYFDPLNNSHALAALRWSRAHTGFLLRLLAVAAAVTLVTMVISFVSIQIIGGLLRTQLGGAGGKGLMPMLEYFASASHRRQLSLIGAITMLLTVLGQAFVYSRLVNYLIGSVAAAGMSMFGPVTMAGAAAGSISGSSSPA